MTEFEEYRQQWFRMHIHPEKDKDGKEFIRVYKYLPKESAVKTLVGGKIKVGRISEFNDPFEVLPNLSKIAANIPRPEIEVWENRLGKQLNSAFGIICLSSDKTLTKPIMWSHYADHHRGIAIGLDVWPDFDGRHFLLPVRYVTERPCVEASIYENGLIRPTLSRGKEEANWKDKALEKIRILLAYKGKEWDYEDEVRQIFPLDGYDALEFSNGMIFHPIRENLVSEIVLGCRCDLDQRELDQILSSNPLYANARVRRAKRHESDFKLTIE